MTLREVVTALREEFDVWSPNEKERGPKRGEGGKPKPSPGKCPPGEVRNTKTGRCVSLRGAKWH